MEELALYNPWINAGMLAELPRWGVTKEALEDKDRTRAPIILVFKNQPDALHLIKDKRFLWWRGEKAYARKQEERKRVWQCQNCYSLEHNSTQCRNPARCEYCSGEHATKDHVCPRQECGLQLGGCDHAVCRNCKQGHRATDRDCPEWKIKCGIAAGSKAANLPSKGKATKPTQATQKPPSTQERRQSEGTVIGKNMVQNIVTLATEFSSMLSPDVILSMLEDAQGDLAKARKLCADRANKQDMEVEQTQGGSSNVPSHE